MDEDDLTVDDRFSSRDIGKGSDDIISAIRDIIDADKALLETDPEAVLVSERTEARLRAALERFTGGSDTPPTVLEALVLEALDPLLRDWLERNLASLVERLVEAEIGRIMASGDRTKQLEADDALV
jgi:cell pole-organizing protein PopZ